MDILNNNIIDNSARFELANLVIDCDEVLCFISPKWVYEMYKKKDIFEPYFDFSKVEDVMYNTKNLSIRVLERDKYYINKWLAKPNIEIPEEILLEFLECYNQEDFYDNMPTTNIANALKILSNHKSIQSIHIITKHDMDKNLDGKLKMLNSLFPKDKLNIHILKTNEKKSDYLNNINLENGLIFEDELGNVKDYLVNGNLKKCAIYIPTYGYNIPDDNLLALSIEHEIPLIYY